MSSRSRLLVMLAMSILINLSFAFSQNDFTKKVVEDIKQSEKGINARAVREGKLQFSSRSQTPFERMNKVR